MSQSGLRRPGLKTPGMPPVPPFRAGLVGAGQISQFHIAGLRRIPIDIVGIYDLNAAAAEATGAKFGVKVFSSLDALVEAGANVIHVLTPPKTHAAVALEALRLGCHVLVEKPLAEDPVDCDRIEAEAIARGLQVCVNHSLLYDPQIVRALETVRSGKLGKVVSVDILRASVYPPYEGGPMPPQFRDGGYPFRDLGIHCLYLLQTFLGPIEDVTAEWQSLGGEPNLAFDEWRASVRCKNGMGQFQLSWNVKPVQNLMIVQGTKGVLRVDLSLMFLGMRSALPLPGPIVRVVNAATDSIRPLIEVPRNVVGFLFKRVLQYHGLQDLIAAFYASLAAGTRMPATVGDAKPLVAWIEEIARRADADRIAHLENYPLSDTVPYLVTGASGSLGGAIVERLLAEGKKVRIFVRRPPAPRDNVEVALGDLGDAAAVAKAVKGAEIVIHAGAAMKGPWEAFMCATIVGTQNVLDGIVADGNVKKLVHISSMSVVDWAGAKAGSPISEATPYEPHAENRGSYTRAKLEAERLVLAAVRERGVPTVILRPGQIFGGKIPLMSAAIARRLGGRYLVLGEGDVSLPLVHMDDVVDAVMTAAAGDLHSGEIIQLIDAGVTQNEVLHKLVDDKAVVRVPRRLVFALGGFSELALGALKRKSPLSRYRLRSALAHRTFHSEHVGLIDWKPRVGVAQGIELEVARGSAK
jgi:predicted dehydrogenase/nucleoside-diphosphate-sugar epimerase